MRGKFRPDELAETLAALANAQGGAVVVGVGGRGLQAEGVAERMTAVPPDMSLLSVSTQFYGRTERITTIKAGAFWPRPDVDSAVVKIDLFAERPLPFSEEEAFFQLVKAGFSQKRKQLQNNLRQLNLSREEVEQLLDAANVNGRRRAQTLTITEWITLYQTWKIAK